MSNNYVKSGISNKVAVVINKSGKNVDLSETFLMSHINDLPFETVSLVGEPGYRYCAKNDSYIQSQNFLSKGLRWVGRKILKKMTVQSQDTESLMRFFVEENISAVLAEYGTTAVTVVDACKKLGIPLVAHFHGYDVYASSNPIIKKYMPFYSRVFKESSALVVVSRDMERRLIEMGAPKEKVFHNACGADIKDISYTPPDKENTITMVGRLVEKKGPVLSILAFNNVLGEIPDCRMHIIGDGPLMGVCRDLVNSLRINDKVVFHGEIAHSEVLGILQKSSIFIQHSMEARDGDKEGTPVGVMEALGLGLPVVATRHGGIVDIIEEGETGFLVDETDYREMAKYIVYLLKNKGLAKKIGDRAKKTVQKKWTTKLSNERLGLIIKESIIKSVDASGSSCRDEGE